jgi:hypothetical protein
MDPKLKPVGSRWKRPRDVHSSLATLEDFELHEKV